MAASGNRVGEPAGESDYDARCENGRPNADSAMRFLRISIEPPAIIQPRQRRTQYSTSTEPMPLTPGAKRT